MENKSYSEKLKDPRWQKKRLEILSRDNWACFWCGDTQTTLHVHHLIYEGKNPWDACDDTLMTLCEDCHAMEHLKLNELERGLFDALRHRDRGQTDMIKLINNFVKRCKGVEVE